MTLTDVFMLRLQLELYKNKKQLSSYVYLLYLVRLIDGNSMKQMQQQFGKWLGIFSTFQIIFQNITHLLV